MPEFRDEVRKRLAPLKLEATREAAIVEEMGQHLDDRYEELKTSGMAEPKAFSTALAELDERGLLAKGLRQVEHQPRFEPVPAGGPSNKGVSTGAPREANIRPAHLFSGKNNNRGITRNSITLCGHAPLILGPLINTKPEDLKVFWSWLTGLFKRRPQ